MKKIFLCLILLFTKFSFSQSLTAITSQTNVTCYGGNDGAASVIASGSSGSYNYLWSSTPTQTTQTANGLVAGTYSVTVSNTVCTVSGNELITNGDFFRLLYKPNF